MKGSPVSRVIMPDLVIITDVGNAEMRCDLADYAGTGRQPGGLRLASLRGPHLTINFWTMTLVSLRYPLGLILSYFTVTRIPLVSSTSALNPKSRARSHLIISTFSPRFLTIYPFVFLDLFSIPLPSPTVISLPFCPDHLTTFLCDTLMRSFDTL